MANTITLKTDNHNERYLQATCKQVKNSSTENSSKIEWELKAVGDDTFYSTGPTELVIGGVTVYSSERIAWSAGKFPVAQGSTSGTINIPHNTDGTKEITVKLSTAIFYTAVKDYSDTWTLDSIPRKPYITVFSLSGKTETEATIKWDADRACDRAQYSLNNGEWVDVGWPSFIISGLKPNTTYSVKMRVRSTESSLWSDHTSDMSITTYDYPYCISAPDFTIGNALTLKFYNPLGRKFNFYVIANGVQINDVWEMSGTEYIGVNSLNTQNLLYATIPNDKKAPYKIKTVWGEFSWTSGGNIMYIDESKCLPTFTDFEYYDKSNVPNILGAVGLIKNQSSLTVKIPEGLKMVTKNGATPDKYIISIDTKNATLNYSDTDTEVELGAISNYGSLRLSVRAYDSRGLPTLVYKDIYITDYEKPIIHADITRKHNFETETTIKVDGTLSPISKADGTPNAVRVSYWVRELGTTNWGAEIPISTTTTAEKYKCDDVVIGLDNSKEFEIWIRVYDLLGYSDLPTSIGAGQAVFFVSSNQKACFINGQKLIVEGDIFYSSGDSYSNNGTIVYLGGHITGGNTEICTNINLPKRLDKISSIIVNSYDITVRGVAGGYLLDRAKSGLTVACTKVDGANAQLVFTSSATLTATNNTPVSVAIHGLSLTFN